ENSLDFEFTSISYSNETFLTEALPGLPKGSAVYRIFDTRGQLIVLDRTSNLFQRLERYFGERSERVKDLDLREITSRIEFRRTWSPFETAYLLYVQRRQYFPKTYRRMRTFRLFTLMKVNRKQRFPRIYASKQIKAVVEYFGPFVTRGQFNRMKTALERTFKLRPCLYNIRGNDPHPDCLYFQMHTCSRPCNNDIDRRGYLSDVEEAMDFIQGRDQALEQRLTNEMNALASDMNFEAAEIIRRRLEKIHRARQDMKDTFHSLWSLNAIVLLPTDSVSRCKIAFVREGGILSFEEYPVEQLQDVLPGAIEEVFKMSLEFESREWQYDEFCLVANFIVDPLQSVDVFLVDKTEDVTPRVIERIQQKKRKRKQSHVDT